MRANRTSRTALTMLEVVLALATLVIVSGMILGSVVFMERVAARDVTRLEAMEVAHRVIMQYIDEPDDLKQFNQRYEFNQSVYQFQLREELLQTGDSEVEGLTTHESTLSKDVDMEEQFRSLLYQVTVTVYREDPNNPDAIPAVFDAQLVRLYNPISLFERDEKRMIDWISQVLSGNPISLTEDEESDDE